MSKRKKTHEDDDKWVALNCRLTDDQDRFHKLWRRLTRNTNALHTVVARMKRTRKAMAERRDQLEKPILPLIGEEAAEIIARASRRPSADGNGLTREQLP